MEFEEPTPPDDYEYLIGWAWRLANRSGSNGFGRNAISFTEIEAWARLTGADPEPWEVAIIEALDDAILSETAKLSAR